MSKSVNEQLEIVQLRLEYFAQDRSKHIDTYKQYYDAPWVGFRLLTYSQSTENFCCFFVCDVSLIYTIFKRKPVLGYRYAMHRVLIAVS